MPIGLLASRVRVEEKLLLEAYAARGVEVVRIDERDLSLRADRPHTPRTWSSYWRRAGSRASTGPR